jgi:beta-galactosidase
VHNHPAIIGYIVDNENKSYGTSSPNVQINFVKYLKDKFKTPDALNAAWGLNFWGQNIASWDDFPARKGTYQPSYQLEWDKFQRTIPFDFLAWQAKIVREYKKPGQFVTHNFDVHGDNNGYGPKVDLNHFMMAKIFDISGMDIYNGSQEDIGPDRISWVDDYTRSLKRDNFFILETQAQTIGWGATSVYPPFEGQLRQSVYTHLSGGANMVAYWHWSTTHNGIEMYCKGILGPDYYPGRAFSDVKQIAAEINKYGSKLINLKKHNDVALLYSYNSNSAFVYQALDNSFYYNTMVNQVYGSMFRQNISMDIVFEDDFSYLSDYKLIVVPSLYIASDGLLKALSDYVKNGGNLLLLPHTGYCDENFKVRSEIMPGILAGACGLTYHEFSKIRDKLPLKDNPFGLEPADNYAKIWTDMLIPGKAEVLANYDHFFFGKYPMLTYNKYGKGSVIYQGAYVSDKLQEKIVLLATEKAGLKTIDQNYYFPIIAKHGVNTENKTVNYLFNYSSQFQTISYNFKKGKSLFPNASVENGDKLNIKPWDLIIVIEE